MTMKHCRLRLVSAAAAFLGLVACVSQIPELRDWADQNVGRPVAELEAIDARPQSYASRIRWQRTTIPLAGGNWIYVHPDRPDCQIHFEVNPAGIIVGYSPVGAGCRNQ
jgi:hypothetical protein